MRIHEHAYLYLFLLYLYVYENKAIGKTKMLMLERRDQRQSAQQVADGDHKSSKGRSSLQQNFVGSSNSSDESNMVLLGERRALKLSALIHTKDAEVNSHINLIQLQIQRSSTPVALVVSRKTKSSFIPKKRIR